MGPLKGIISEIQNYEVFSILPKDFFCIRKYFLIIILIINTSLSNILKTKIIGFRDIFACHKKILIDTKHIPCFKLLLPAIHDIEGGETIINENIHFGNEIILVLSKIIVIFTMKMSIYIKFNIPLSVLIIKWMTL